MSAGEGQTERERESYLYSLKKVQRQLTSEAE